jgi:hypothetical protein
MRNYKKKNSTASERHTVYIKGVFHLVFIIKQKYYRSITEQCRLRYIFIEIRYKSIELETFITSPSSPFPFKSSINF